MKLTISPWTAAFLLVYLICATVGVTLAINQPKHLALVFDSYVDDEAGNEIGTLYRTPDNACWLATTQGVGEVECP